MNMLQCILLILVSVGSSFVQRVTGFGLGIFNMLFLPYFLPSSSVAAAISGMQACVLNVYHGVTQRRHILWRTMIPVLAAAMLAIPVAVSLSTSLPQSFLKQLLGVVLMVLSVYFLFFSQRIHMRPTVPNGLIAGACGGMLNGLFSTGGPPVVLYLLHATSDKLTYFATIQAYFGITNLFSTGNRILSGVIDWQLAGYTAISMVGILLGDRLGSVVFHRLNAEKFRKIIYIGMLVSGLLMVLPR